MNDSISNNNLKIKITSLAELIILLLLPLPVFKLNFLYLLTALIIMFLSKYLRKEKMSEYGFKPTHLRLFLLAIFMGIFLGFLDNFFIEKLITLIVGSEPDLLPFDGVKGSVKGLIAMLALGWIVEDYLKSLFSEVICSTGFII